MMRSIANGLSVFYNSFGNDLEGVNFSSMRSGALEERDNWKTCQRFFIENFLEKIYREWLRMFLLSGLSILPISKKDKFLNVVFQGRRWAWVDPYKDIQANALAIQSLIRSPQDVIRESGRDPEDVIAEISQFEQTVNKMGLTLFNIKKEVVNNADDAEENTN
jgi:lambda family phage portal protein